MCRIERDSETFPTAASHLRTLDIGQLFLCHTSPWRFRSDWIKEESDEDRDRDGDLKLAPIPDGERQQGKQHLSFEDMANISSTR